MHKSVETETNLHFFATNNDKVAGAFFGAACGDALGWPFEGYAKKKPDPKGWRGDFCAWEKVSGGRFHASLEKIEAGEFSDDTQLILAISRSLLQFDHWWLQFALVELPFWTLYERGGGGATKRAATSWSSGVPPWHEAKADAKDRYLKAGGNGVAMRVLPHCVQGYATETSFNEIAVNIVTDGVITHGHPRALVGALAYGYAIFSLLRKAETLRFGEVVDHLIHDAPLWSSQQYVKNHWPDWWETVSGNEPLYLAVWDETVQEMLSLLSTVKLALADGPLTSDATVLKDLGALASRTNGAGTVTCAAAIYYASRYAATPIEGLVYSASMVGADTDTLASMTGALLGALAGKEWLAPYLHQLQDRNYVEAIAKDLCRPRMIERDFEIRELGKADLAAFVGSLAEVDCDNLRLPNGMIIGRVTRMPFLRAGSRSRSHWKISTQEGATLYVRGAFVKDERPNGGSSIRGKNSNESDSAVVGFGVSLDVSNLGRSREFYENALGMAVSGETRRSVRFDSSLVVRESDVPVPSKHYVTLFLNVTNAAAVHSRLRTIDGINPGPLSIKGNTQSFEVRDPDQYLIEVYARVPGTETTRT